MIKSLENLTVERWMSAKVVCKVSVLYIKDFLFYGTYCTWAQIPIHSDSNEQAGGQNDEAITKRLISSQCSCLDT